ncbi:MAG TPA: hypothetical protein VNU68_33280 [Verrucomicrobiae bacterium]|nr:hypothetical protein [Verrucomicrobiae bacterium]
MNTKCRNNRGPFCLRSVTIYAFFLAALHLSFFPVAADEPASAAIYPTTARALTEPAMPTGRSPGGSGLWNCPWPGIRD